MFTPIPKWSVGPVRAYGTGRALDYATLRADETGVHSGRQLFSLPSTGDMPP